VFLLSLKVGTCKPWAFRIQVFFLIDECSTGWAKNRRTCAARLLYRAGIWETRWIHKTI